MSDLMPVKQSAKGRKNKVAARVREAAERANSEADLRRTREKAERLSKEVGGPTGPEPTRYGDWEHKGLTSDF